MAAHARALLEYQMNVIDSYRAMLQSNRTNKREVSHYISSTMNRHPSQYQDVLFVYIHASFLSSLSAMAQLWDPRAVLDLYPEIKGFKCSGTTKKGNRCCQTFLTNANKAQAGQIIRLLSTRDIVDRGVDEGVIDQFRNLAGCTLCPRWHIGDQAQVNTTVMKFRRAAERYVAEVRAQRVRAQGQNERHQEREVPGRVAEQRQEQLRQAGVQVQHRAQPVNRVSASILEMTSLIIQQACSSTSTS